MGTGWCEKLSLEAIFLCIVGAETTLFAGKFKRAPCLSTMANPARVSCA